MRVRVNRIGGKVEVIVKTNGSEIVFESSSGRLWPVAGSGVYEDLVGRSRNSPFSVPYYRDIRGFFEAKGFDFLPVGFKIVGGPKAFVVGDDVAFGVEVEVRGSDIDGFDSIRVPVSKVMPLKVGLWPMRYYISVSKSGSVYVTEYEKIFECLLDGRVWSRGGNWDEVKRGMYVEVPKEYWCPVRVSSKLKSF